MYRSLNLIRFHCISKYILTCHKFRWCSLIFHLFALLRNVLFFVVQCISIPWILHIQCWWICRIMSMLFIQCALQCMMYMLDVCLACTQMLVQRRCPKRNSRSWQIETRYHDLLVRHIRCVQGDAEKRLTFRRLSAIHEIIVPLHHLCIAWYTIERKSSFSFQTIYVHLLMRILDAASQRDACSRASLASDLHSTQKLATSVHTCASKILIFNHQVFLECIAQHANAPMLIAHDVQLQSTCWVPFRLIAADFP